MGRFLVLVCAIVLLAGMFSTPALAASTAWKLNGRWSCFYAYDMYWGNQNMDDVYYTFYDISGNSGKYKYENFTLGVTEYGIFTLTEGSAYSEISFRSGIDEQVFEFRWGYDNTFTLEAADIYLGHYEKQ